MRPLNLWHYSRHFYAISAILLCVFYQALWLAAVLSTAYMLDLFVGMKARQNPKKAPTIYQAPFVKDLTVIDVLEPEFEVEEQAEPAEPAVLLEKGNQHSIQTREVNANDLLLQSTKITREGAVVDSNKSAQETPVDAQNNTPGDAGIKEISAEEWNAAIQSFRLNKFNLYKGVRGAGGQEKTPVDPISLILENEEA